MSRTLIGGPLSVTVSSVSAVSCVVVNGNRVWRLPYLAELDMAPGDKVRVDWRTWTIVEKYKAA